MSFAALILVILICVPVCLTSSADGVDSSGRDTVGTLPLVLKAEGDVPEYTGQLSLGGAVADGAILLTGADAALIPQKDLLCNLLAGEVTEEKLAMSVADNELVTVSVSGKQLKEILEAGLSHLTLNDTTKRIDYEQSVFDGFPQVGGFTYEGDLSAPVGDRVVYITLDDGTELSLEDETEHVLFVTTAEVASGAYGYPKLEAHAVGSGERDALTAIIESGTLNAQYSVKNRLKLIGHTGDSLAGYYPVGIIAVAAIIVIMMTARSETGFIEMLRSRWSSRE